MISRLTVVLFVLALASCNPGEREQAAIDLLIPQIALIATDEGPTQIDRQGDFRNVLVELKNGSDKTVWVRAIKTMPVSDYLRDRNPDGICYSVEWHDTIWRDANIGLGGTPSDAHPIPAGETISFRAPIVVDAPNVKGSEIRIALRLYAAADASNAALIASAPLKLP